MTPSTPEAEDDFDPTVAADLDAETEADLASDPLDAVLAAEGDVADLNDELDEELEVDLDVEDLDADLDEDEDEDGDEDLEDDEELDDDADAEDLAPTAGDGTDDDGVTPALALDPAFEEEDEDLAAAVVGDDDDEDVDGLRDGEFVCRSCFLAKRDTQLADPERMLCRDCA